MREEIAFGPLNMGLTPDEVHERVDDVLAMLEIDALVDRAPFQLSGGQKKQVAIASVLAMNPEVLLFDEPTAGLDPRTQTWLLELMREMSAIDKTIVVATHDLASLSTMAERCVVFSEQHRIVADGSTDAVLDDTASLEAANLLPRSGQPPRNQTTGNPDQPEVGSNN